MSQWQAEIDGWIVLIGILSACSCTLLGNYLVLRKMSLMGDAISHAVLPGLAIAFIVSNSRAPLPMFLGAVGIGALTTLLTESIRRYGKVEHGAAMGVVFSIFFAVGLILIRQAADHVDLDPGCVLYGNILLTIFDTVEYSGIEMPRAVLTIGFVMLLNALFVMFLFKELMITAFDPAYATTQGVNAAVMHYALMIMVALTTVANFESVGSILVIAMLIVPAASAHLLTDRLGWMILISLIIAAGSAVLGHVLAAFGPGWLGMDADVNTAAMMAVVTGMCLGAALLFSPQYGMISRFYHRYALSSQIVREDMLGLLYRWRELDPRKGVAITRTELIGAVGGGWIARWALKSLQQRCDVRLAGEGGGGDSVLLSESGASKASKMVRSHRLWESYLAKHFNLPLDHLHLPAERMEHYITADMDDELRRQLTDPSHDPHGKIIPED